MEGLSVEETLMLYTPAFFDAMGYRERFSRDKRLFLQSLENVLPSPETWFEHWQAQRPFCYSFNHPHLHVTRDILAAKLVDTGVTVPPPEVLAMIPDPLLAGLVFPTLNHPSKINELGRPDCFFKLGNGRVFGLEQFVRMQFKQVERSPELSLLSDEDRDQFRTALEKYRARTIEAATNPYKGRAPRSYWSSSVARPAPENVQPTARLRPAITGQTRVATAGSCFAQHIARTLASNGLTYYVTETAPPSLTAPEAEAFHYGVYSARYGNIYSPRQLKQLFDRAYGRLAPRHDVWKDRNGAWIDPFRPNIGQVFDSREALLSDRKHHFGAVRKMFETLDVFVFTMGLTEAWVDAVDGSVFPVSPGVVAREIDAAEIAFQNFGHDEIRADMTDFLLALKSVNPKAQMILTVSPVPLIATYSGNDALSATIYSKSVLRAVAENIADTYSCVQYFPSYEIITGTYNRGAYFEPDLRSVRPEGVAHVMRVFMETLVAESEQLEQSIPDAISAQELASYQAYQDIICDEELNIRDI